MVNPHDKVNGTSVVDGRLVRVVSICGPEKFDSCRLKAA